VTLCTAGVCKYGVLFIINPEGIIQQIAINGLVRDCYFVVICIVCFIMCSVLSSPVYGLFIINPEGIIQQITINGLVRDMIVILLL
jgi:alkyl hydroperoxide reductase subunit AhpC